MRRDTISDVSSESEGEAEDETRWTDYLSAVLADDGEDGVMRNVPGPVAEEILRAMHPWPSDDLVQHYAAVGQFISMAADLERSLSTLATFLLNPVPQHARPAVRGLNARTTRELVKSLLVPRWPDTTRLVNEAERVAHERNLFAHYALTPFRIAPDDSSVIYGVTRTHARSTRRGVELETVETPVSYIQAWVSRARLTGYMTRQVLVTLAYGVAHDMGETLSSSLDAYVDPDKGELTPEEIRLYAEFW